ncbi:MAG: T9SS type A sorting domain-containing protein [Bacteroidales bacterium]
MKTKLSLYIMLLFPILHLYCQPPQVIWILPSSGSPIPFVYSGGDEFNGESLDLDKWDTHGGLHNRRCNYEVQYYTDENIEVSDGSLKLIAKHEDIFGKPIEYEPEDYIIGDCGEPNTARTWHYTSGNISYKRPIKWELMDFRCRLPNEGQGLWAAFWQHGGVPPEEIDYIEAKGESPEEIHVAIHYPDGSLDGDWWDLGFDLTNELRDYLFLWKPGMVIAKCENIHVCSYDLTPELTKATRPIINLAIAGNGDVPFSPGPNDDTDFPAVFEVDHIRFYSLLEEGSIIEICNYSQDPEDMTSLSGDQITLGGDNNCHFEIKENEFLSVIASDNILLKKGFHVHSGGNFSAHIVNLYDDNTKSDSSLFSKHKTEQYSAKSNDQEISNNDKNVVQSIDQYNSIKIYPNPSQGEINIELSKGIENIISISLYNNNGEEVFVKREILLFNTIYISHLPSGFYLLKIKTSDKELINKIVLK